MSRLEVRMPAQAQTVIEQIYSSMERRIEANPPGLCPVDMTLNFLGLCQAQTCGKCAPCRIGLDQLSQMIREVLDGEPDPDIAPSPSDFGSAPPEAPAPTGRS